MNQGDPNNVNGAASYTYDPVGNRTQKVSTIPGYPGGLTNYNANDQISTDTYDNEGNTTASNGLGYAYDFENHLVQAGGGISIVYDGTGGPEVMLGNEFGCPIRGFCEWGGLIFLVRC